MNWWLWDSIFTQQPVGVGTRVWQIVFNLLKPSSNLTYDKKYKKFYMVPTLHLCVLYESQKKQQLLPYTPFTDWFCTNKVESIYCTV
jgi:hypothetical protein